MLLSLALIGTFMVLTAIGLVVMSHHTGYHDSEDYTVECSACGFTYVRPFPTGTTFPVESDCYRCDKRTWHSITEVPL